MHKTESMLWNGLKWTVRWHLAQSQYLPPPPLSNSKTLPSRQENPSQKASCELRDHTLTGEKSSFHGKCKTILQCIEKYWKEHEKAIPGKRPINLWADAHECIRDAHQISEDKNDRWRLGLARERGRSTPPAAAGGGGKPGRVLGERFVTVY